MPDFPPRLTTDELCTLGRISERTFSRRRRDGVYIIEPIDRGRENLWSRDQVLTLFGMTVAVPTPAPIPETTKPRVDPDAIRAARAGQIRQRPGPPRGRDIPRPVRGAEKAPALRLAFDATASD